MHICTKDTDITYVKRIKGVLTYKKRPIYIQSPLCLFVKDIKNYIQIPSYENQFICLVKRIEEMVFCEEKYTSSLVNDRMVFHITPYTSGFDFEAKSIDSLPIDGDMVRVILVLTSVWSNKYSRGLSWNVLQYQLNTPFFAPITSHPVKIASPPPPPPVKITGPPPPPPPLPPKRQDHKIVIKKKNSTQPSTATTKPPSLHDILQSRSNLKKVEKKKEEEIKSIDDDNFDFTKFKMKLYQAIQNI